MLWSKNGADHIVFRSVYSMRWCSFCNREEQNLTPCWICSFYFYLCSLLLFVTIITKRMLSIALSKHNDLPQGTLSLCLNVKLKCLCSAHRETPWPCPPVNGCKKEEINTSPSRGWPNQEMFCNTYGLFTLFPHLLPLSVLKKKLASRPHKMVL